LTDGGAISKWHSPEAAKRVAFVLLALIVIGTIIRFALPFFYNPLRFLVSDAGRHYFDAIRPSDGATINLLDPVGYQIWLGAVVRIIGDNRIAAAIYAGGLNAITPWFWYRWMRELFANKNAALAGWAALVWLPSWIKLGNAFMDTTILLPAVGIALWLSWRAVRKQSPGAYIWAAIGWGLASTIKLFVLPFLGIVWLWLGRNMLSQFPGRWRALATACSVIMIAFYSLTPLKIFTHLNTVELFPPGQFNRLYYESGKRSMEMYCFHKTASTDHYYFTFTSPAVVSKPFYPLSNWESARQGVVRFNVEFPVERRRYEPMHMSFEDRFRYTIENMIFFFFDYSWPEDGEIGGWDTFTIHFRWFWLPFTIATLVLGLKRHRRDIVFALFSITLAVFLFQQGGVMEARYRKIWEGIAIATFIGMFARSRAISSPNSTAVVVEPDEIGAAS
jgi:hypothetical protein